MTKRYLYSVPSLIAAGFLPVSASADDNVRNGENRTSSFLDQIEEIVSSIGETEKYTLAAHGSHQSHASHYSHQSHRSYYAPPPPPEDDLLYDLQQASTRNELSTPPSSVLPSSPAIAKKLKLLPGNSKKFRDLVMLAQVALVTKGYDVGEINGEVHARTVAAVYQYQNDLGMIPSGKLTNEVLGSLGIVAK